MAEKWPDAQRSSAQLCARFYDHIPPPPDDLFRWIQTRDGRVELWCKIPAGSFLMGSPGGEEGGYEDERPQHRVVVRSAFRIAAVPVTVTQYAAFDPEHRSYHQGKVPEDRIGSHPVEQVSWYAACAFCRWLSSHLDGAQSARLPAEEEWEYACRAGTDTRYWKGDGGADLAETDWYLANSDRRTHRVGRKPANPWGLYDVHGNVWEWTSSPWTDNYSGREGGIDPAAAAAQPLPGGLRVYRGGSFLDGAGFARSACRSGNQPQNAWQSHGFRVLLPVARASTVDH